MKRFIKGSSAKMSFDYKKGVPAKINHKFLRREVDAAFISSIKAKGYKNIALGIVAKKEVLSVLVIPHVKTKKDKESASSNILAQILGVDGEVLIGDKALRYYLSQKPHVDLAKLWYEKHNLPFVFALLCYHKDKKLYSSIKKNFLKRKVKIPQYILKEAAKRTQIAPEEILNYLLYISYEIDTKAQKGLKKFYKEAKKI